MTQENITWVDVTAPGDGCAFALCNPVSVSGVATDAKRWPLVFSAAFTQALSPARWKELRRNFFWLHFQYMFAFDRPRDYDYFQITAGPKNWVIAMPIVRRQNHGSIAPFLKTHWWPHDRSSAKAKKLLKQGVIAALHALVSPRHYIGATCYACTARGWLNFARRYFTVR